MKSPLKYAGGKQKLLKTIQKYFPTDFNNYYEPFLGSGVVFLNTECPNGVYFINDINKCIVGFFKDILNHHENLINIIKGYKDSVEDYQINRKRFNEIKDNASDSIERSALLFYLNKCCFNGLYRENKLGEFNVPYSKKRKFIDFEKLDYSNIINLNKILNSRNIMVSEGLDYKIVLENASKKDFVYIDPPYDNTFAQYTKHDFSWKEQIELKEHIDHLTSRGVMVLMSNSDTERIRDLYFKYTIISLDTVYTLGSIPTSRSKIKKEVLIANFSNQTSSACCKGPV